MALFNSFQNVKIYKPGAYSVTNVANSPGGLPTDDTILLVGESSSGPGGNITGFTTFTADQMRNLVNMYGSGPLVDCALAAATPSKQQGIGGAGSFVIWKTNHTTQASLTVKEATNTSPLFSITDDAWGESGNDLSVTIVAGDTGKQVNITINRLNSPSESLGENPATPVISIHYTGNASTALAVISGSTLANKTLAITLSGQSDGSVSQSLILSQYSFMKLVNYLNTQTGYTAVLLDPTKSANSSSDLDSLASTSVASTVSFYRLQQEVLAILNSSVNISATLATVPVIGLPQLLTNAFLTGGTLGASANSDFAAGFNKSLAQTYNVALPCISNDATADIANLLTDPSSTYTIASVQAALTSHLILREQVKNRKEAQGMTGFRNASSATCFTAAATIGSALVQMTMQDVLVLDQNSNLTWKYPHVQAALMAGIRLGTPIGEPLTFKYLNCNGMGHVVNPITGISAGDFDTNLDSDAAIIAGVTFAEQVPAGFRIVVDNTTYGIDQNFVWNRGSVVEAAQFIAKDLRSVAEANFVGKKLAPGKVSGGKISGGAAASLKNALKAEMIRLNAPDVNIISSDLDAPQGFVDDGSFSVTVIGNTATVAVTVLPVQGGDFVDITFTLGQTNQSA